MNELSSLMQLKSMLWTSSTWDILKYCTILSFYVISVPWKGRLAPPLYMIVWIKKNTIEPLDVIGFCFITNIFWVFWLFWTSGKWAISQRRSNALLFGHDYWFLSFSILLLVYIRHSKNCCKPTALKFKLGMHFHWLVLAPGMQNRTHWKCKLMKRCHRTMMFLLWVWGRSLKNTCANVMLYSIKIL